MKKWVVTVIVVLALGGGLIYYFRSGVGTPSQGDVSVAKLRPGMPGWSGEMAGLGTDQQASEKLLTPEEVRNALSDLKNLTADLERVKSLYEKKDRKRYREESEVLKKKIREIQIALRATILKSAEAQAEVLKVIGDVSDVRTKRELSRLLGELDVDTQSKYFGQLAETADAGNQQVAVHMLSMLKTDAALEGIRKVADNPKVDAKVRGEALIGMGRSIAYHDDPAFRDKTRQAIYGFAEPKYDPALRKSAYQALVMSPYITKGDKAFLDKAVENEKDPQALRAAQFARKVAEASLRSKEKRGATVQ